MERATILIVDDHELVRTQLAKTLEELNYLVATAERSRSHRCCA